MKWFLPLAAVLAVAAAPARADDRSPGAFARGTRVVVVGPITSQPRDAGVVVENKLQVGIGPERQDYTLHLKDAQLLGMEGNRIEKSALKDRMWIRAEGEIMDKPHRIRVDRLQVIGRDLPGLQQSAFYRPGFDQGYVFAVAGSRETYPETPGPLFTAAPFTIVGRVSDDAGKLETTRRLRLLSAGNEWTLNVTRDAEVLDAKGEKISVHEVKKGQWVRATGWQTDDLRMRIVRLENIGLDEAYQQSQVFRAALPLGYLDRLRGVRDDGKPVSISGTVTSIDTEGGYFTVRDAEGKEHSVYAELAEVRRNERTVPFLNLRSGDVVTVQVRHIQF